MTNALTLTEKSKKQRDNIKNATKNFDYTTIADPLRTVSWSNSSYPTGVVKPGLRALNLPTHRKSSVINRTQIVFFVTDFIRIYLSLLFITSVHIWQDTSFVTWTRIACLPGVYSSTETPMSC